MGNNLPGSDEGARVVGRATLEIRSERQNEVHLVQPAGEVDLAVTDLLDEEMRRAEATDASTILLDLSGLEFIDAAGIGLLLDLCKRSRAAAADRLRIRPGAEPVKKLIRITGVEEHLPLVA